MFIHPTAVVDPRAELGPDCEVGPGAIIEADVKLGARCKIGPYAMVGRYTRMGDGNQLYIGAVVGNPPQDLKFDPKMRSQVIVGNNNVFREYCTVHRSAKPDGVTVLGDNNYLMNQSHVAHDCVIANGVILASGALIAGHVYIGDRAFISGNSGIHQFCRVGRIAMLRGVSAVSKDIPPFCIADTRNQLRTLNMVGLRRAGIEKPAREALVEVFRMLFRTGEPLAVALEAVAASPHMAVAEVHELVKFCKETKRGVVKWSTSDNGMDDDDSTDA